MALPIHAIGMTMQLPAEMSHSDMFRKVSDQDEWIHGSPITITPEWKADKGVSMGTTLAAVEYAGGVIIAADSRTSSGVYVANRVTDKLTEVAKNIYCCRSGSAADTQAIADVVKTELEYHRLETGKPTTVQLAANMFQSMCYQYRDQLSAGIIVGGWDALEGGQVFSVPIGGMCVRQPVSVGGSGSTYLYGYIDSNYRPDMKKEECLEFMKKAVALAIKRDGSSGGVVRIAVINQDGVERHVFTGNDIPQFPEF